MPIFSFSKDSFLTVFYLITGKNEIQYPSYTHYSRLLGLIINNNLFSVLLLSFLQLIYTLKINWGQISIENETRYWKSVGIFLTTHRFMNSTRLKMPWYHMDNHCFKWYILNKNINSRKVNWIFLFGYFNFAGDIKIIIEQDT